MKEVEDIDELYLVNDNIHQNFKPNLVWLFEIPLGCIQLRVD
ncbi:hypothetical protein [Planktothrix agardhii]|jgi:hypothetical protein|nr:hypothetical protein [Planktothrix agardhii]